MQKSKDKEFQFVDVNGESCSPDSLLLINVKSSDNPVNIKLPLLNPYKNNSLLYDELSKINEINLLSTNINSLNLYIISSLNKSQIYKTVKEEIRNKILSAYTNYICSLNDSSISLDSHIELLKQFREKTFEISSYFNSFIFNRKRKSVQKQMLENFKESSNAVCNTQVIDFSSRPYNTSSEA